VSDILKISISCYTEYKAFWPSLIYNISSNEASSQPFQNYRFILKSLIFWLWFFWFQLKRSIWKISLVCRLVWPQTKNQKYELGNFFLFWLKLNDQKRKKNRFLRLRRQLTECYFLKEFSLISFWLTKCFSVFLK
jgi:hypothetical protein